MARLRHLVALAFFLGLVLRAGAAEPWGFDPRFRLGPADEVLVKGPPPLRRADVDAFVDLLQASFDLRVPADKERALRDALETDFGKADPAARARLLALTEPIDDLCAAAAKRDLGTTERGLETFRRALDAFLAETPDAPSSRLVGEVLRARGRAAWDGEPPIHAPAADAWLDLVELVVSLGRNEDVEPTPGQRSVVREELGAAFHGLDPKVRTRLLHAHRTLVRLEAHWDAADEARRLVLRMDAAHLLADALPEDERITVEEGGDAVRYARVATLLRTVQSDYEAWSSLAHQVAPVLDLVDRWLGPPPLEGAGALLAR